MSIPFFHRFLPYFLITVLQQMICNKKKNFYLVIIQHPIECSKTSSWSFITSVGYVTFSLFHEMKYQPNNRPSMSNITCDTALIPPAIVLIPFFNNLDWFKKFILHCLLYKRLMERMFWLAHNKDKSTKSWKLLCFVNSLWFLSKSKFSNQELLIGQ